MGADRMPVGPGDDTTKGWCCARRAVGREDDESRGRSCPLAYASADFEGAWQLHQLGDTAFGGPRQPGGSGSGNGTMAAA